MVNQKFTQMMEKAAEARDKYGIDIDGKLYTKVHDRILLFRQLFGDEYGIFSEVLPAPEGAIMVRATITSSEMVIASGLSMVWIGSDDYTTHAPVEVAETSAIGRALACLGISGGEYASVDEIMKARPDKQVAASPGKPQAPAKPVPPEQRLGLYVPEDEDAIWMHPDQEIQKVVDELQRVRNQDDLGRYYAELRPFMQFLRMQHPNLANDLRAEFSIINNKLGA